MPVRWEPGDTFGDIFLMSPQIPASLSERRSSLRAHAYGLDPIHFRRMLRAQVPPIVFTILFGTTKFKLSYSEYVTILSLMGFLTGVTLFSWMVVFTFRKNLLMAAKYSLAPVQNTGKYLGN